MRRHLDFGDELLPSRVSQLRRPLLRCARGELPPNIALMQLLMEAQDPSEVDVTFDQVVSAIGQQDANAMARLRQALDLWEGTPEAFATVHRIAQVIEREAIAPTGQQALGYWAAVFDRSLELSPAASVALYSLGRPDLLHKATEEIIDRMRTWKLFPPECTALEIGCGNGRILHAIASEVRLTVGIDISSGMLTAARERCAKQSSIVVARTSGRDLAAFAGACFDLVYAVDSFPYLVSSGFAACHLQEATRVLKRDGHLLIMNYSYRGTLEPDRREIATMAGKLGLTVVRDGTGDLAYWDATTFLLQKS